MYRKKKRRSVALIYKMCSLIFCVYDNCLTLKFRQLMFHLYLYLQTLDLKLSALLYLLAGPK